ncbi:MAG: hypothetical protein H7Y33_01000 [Cytophagales bacterium]|nr:hypothetical protein [Rhizobacter sp.]
MTGNQSEAPWPALRRASRTVVVVDVVESVRLMEQDEDDTIRRWQSFVGEVVTRLLPQHGGRLVKSLGDGLMLEFESVPPAIRCALAMQQAIQPYNQGRASERWMCLRIGAHVADVVVDERDIYGSGVNLAARIATLAGPQEIVVSAEVRDALVPGLDAELEDLGDCFVKHLAEPVRAYRAGGIGPQPVMTPMHDATQPAVPTVAIMPFEARVHEPQHAAIGELIADTVIAHLSKHDSVRVISRLSTSALKDRSLATQQHEAGARLGARYALTGTFSVSAARLVVTAELTQTARADVVWAERLVVALDDLFEPQSELAHLLCAGALSAVESSEIERAFTQPLPSLESFTLQLGAVSLMHRASRREFDRVEALLNHLVDRHGRLPAPRAWLAKWHVLRVTRGLVADLDLESKVALSHTRRALDSDPGCALALAMEGFVHCHMRRDLEAAGERYELALKANPHESMAWLFKSVLHAFQGEGVAAMDSAQRAISLSPLDPLRYYYDSLGASAALSAGQYDEAQRLAERSLRANRTHSSTWRVLAMAQALAGRVVEAQATGQELLKLEPGFSVNKFLARSPSARFEIGRICAEALRMAGVPE